MPTEVFAAVMVAALLHATWNALLKSGADKVASTAAIALGSLPPASLILLWTGLPHSDAWGLVTCSAAIHAFYLLS